jgi:hypothetical protein
MYQVGFDFQAGVLTGVVKESAEIKICDIAMNHASQLGHQSRRGSSLRQTTG